VWKQEQTSPARLCYINNNDGIPKHVAGDICETVVSLFLYLYGLFFTFLHIVRKLKTTHLTLFSTTHSN